MATQSMSVYLQMSRLAWRNVIRNWRHSLATILAIASGFMAVSLFDGFLTELHERNVDGFTARGMLGNVVVQKEGANESTMEDQWRYSITKEEQDFLEAFLKNDPDFLRRVRFLYMVGMVNAGPYNTVFSSYAVDVKEGGEVRGKRWYWYTTAGEPLDQVREPSASIGMGLGHLIDCESTYQGPSFLLEDGNYVAEKRPFVCKHPRVTLSATTEAAQVNAIDLPVSGLFDAGFRELDKRAVRIDLAQAQRLLDTDKISMVTVQLNHPDRRAAFMARLKQAIAAKGYKLQVDRWEDHPMTSYVMGGLQILHVFRNLFMTIVVLIGVMSVANTMMKSVNERIREIGTLRSIGFLRRHLVWMFSVEGAFLSLVACGVGLVATIVITFAIDHMGITYKAGILSLPINLKVRYSVTAWIVSATVLAVLATSTAWFCSRRASRMVVADAMRHV
jgi:putative ABC transport system permease protein